MAPHGNSGSARWLILLVGLFLVSGFGDASRVGAAAGTGLALITSNSKAPGETLDPGVAAERIDALRNEIAYHDELYFKKSAPVISDASYDLLKRELAELEIKFPIAAPGTATAAGVGDDRVDSFARYRHRTRMLSLNKSYSEAELRAFDARLMKQLGRRELEYVVEPKFDGLAISVTYEKGQLIRAVTRGDGAEGDDVTANVLTIRSLPRRLSTALSSGEAGASTPVPDIVELRGEVFISWAEFARINQARESAGEPAFSNPRNLAAGTLKQLDVGVVTQRKLEIVFYGWGACEPAVARPESQQALLRQLRSWGLPTVEAPRSVRGADAMCQAVKAVGRERAKYPFPTDGAVVKIDAVALQDQLGATTQAPLWAIAYKFNPERAETQLRSITWQIGRTGVLTPVAELMPVKLGGSTIARASLFNADEILRRDIRVGDFVTVEKAGEIIPVVAGVNRARRGPNVNPYVFPTECPSCRSALVQSVAEAAWRCPNGNCPAQIKRRVEYFASAGCVGIHGLGPVMVDKLVQRGLVKEVADLYRLRGEDLVLPGGKVGKSAERLLRAIEESKRAALWRFINGLGIAQVGPVTARALAWRFGGLAELAAARREDFFRDGLPAIHGVGEGPARAVLTHFAQAENQEIVRDLVALGVCAVASERL